MVDPDTPSPPTSRAIAMFVVVFVVLALIVAAAWFAGGSPSGAPVTCKGDGRLGPNGEVHGRSSEHGCAFVDADGNVLPGQ